MQPPRLPSIFKHRGPRGFNPKTVYYDERKERLKELRRQGGDASVHEAAEDRIRNRWERVRSRVPKQQYNSNALVFLIFGMLLLLAYLLFY